MSNKNRHRKQHSGKTCRQQAIVWGLSDDLHGYKFSYIAVQIKFRNTLLTTVRLVVASEGRMSDIAFKAIHEQEEWATGAPVCRAFGPLRDKGHKIEILIKYKWMIKVENCCCKTTLRVETISPNFADEPFLYVLFVAQKAQKARLQKDNRLSVKAIKRIEIQ